MTDFGESYAHLSDGLPIYYFEEGAGPPFLFLHHGLTSADGTRPLIGSLRDRFHCIAPDQVDYGRSGRLDHEPALEDEVEAIAAVHRACSSDPAWVFGHSSGGNWATAYAVAYPHRVSGLVLMEPALHGTFPKESRPPGVSTMIEEVTPLFREGRLREAIARFFGAFDPSLSPAAQRQRAINALSGDQLARWESVAREMPLVVGWAPTSEEWQRISQPALVIEGDQSVGWLREIAATVAKLLPRSELVTLEGLGHNAPTRAPEVVARVALAFIDRAEAEPSSA